MCERGVDGWKPGVLVIDEGEGRVSVWSAQREGMGWQYGMAIAVWWGL